jgi:uncharacterized protein with PIN domain
LTFPRGDLRRGGERVPSRWLMPSLRALAGDATLQATDWQHVRSPHVVVRASHATAAETGTPVTTQGWRQQAALAGQLADPVVDAAIDMRRARVCERQTRRTLGEQAFQTVYQHGKGLALGDAIAYALNEKPQAAPPPPSTRDENPHPPPAGGRRLAEGLSNKEIADRLVISPRTAEGHVERILTKLGFTSRTKIAAWAIPQASNAQDRRP